MMKKYNTQVELLFLYTHVLFFQLCYRVRNFDIRTVHGWRKYWIIHWGRGPTYSARSKPQYNSAFATRVLQSTYVYVKEETAWGRIFKLFRTSGINSTKVVSSFYTHTSIYAGGTDSLEIFALLKSLKIWALENYVCLLRHTFTVS
jgi:hypothetical protein